MSHNCFCVNLDKDEYINVGEVKNTSFVGSKECNTVEYFLATEWSKNEIVFAFENMPQGGVSPDSSYSLYDYAERFFDERSILNRTPEYRYIVNLTNGLHFDKNDIPKADDGSMFNPISMLLSSNNDEEIIGIKPKGTELPYVGMWQGCRVTAVNDISRFPTSKCIKPDFIKEIKIKARGIYGKTFVVTGTMQGYDRYDITNIIKDNGGISKPSVTKNTDYLIVGSKPGNSKLMKARNYGIREITQDEFFEMVKEEV